MNKSCDINNLPKMALSIRQPWAWAILELGKDIENRSWQTKYRGPVCIHASKACREEDFNSAATFIGWERMRPGYMPRDYQRGGIIGVVDIVDCVARSESSWFFGPYGFILANPRPVDFIPVAGALNFFEWRKKLVHEGTS